MVEKLDALLQDLMRKAPSQWLLDTSILLKNQNTLDPVDRVLKRLPVTGNADLTFLMQGLLRQAQGAMSWEALGWVIATLSRAYKWWQAEQQIELLLTGPKPSGGQYVRRIDQALYDLVQASESEIILITFAAVKIVHLAKALIKAQQRGVRVTLILEFESSSDGQLSFDALKAFPSELTHAATVYCWPIEKRERNQVGKPGKLHAKVALIDDTVLVSSANLTDDAFNRNLEVGVQVKGGDHPKILREYIGGLCMSRVLMPVV